MVSFEESVCIISYCGGKNAASRVAEVLSKRQFEGAYKGSNAFPKLANKPRSGMKVDSAHKRNILQKHALFLDKFRGNADAKYIPLTEYLCIRNRSSGGYKIPRAPNDDHFITLDYGHLSLIGSKYDTKFFVILTTST